MFDEKKNWVGFLTFYESAHSTYCDGNDFSK